MYNIILDKLKSKYETLADNYDKLIYDSKPNYIFMKDIDGVLIDVGKIVYRNVFRDCPNFLDHHSRRNNKDEHHYVSLITGEDMLPYSNRENNKLSDYIRRKTVNPTKLEFLIAKIEKNRQ